MTVWSPVMMRDELDLLAMRLEELGPYGVQTVITESPVTHRGVPKPLHYAGNLELFAKWNDSIVHVAADLPELPEPEWSPDDPVAKEAARLRAWRREHAQRNAAWPAIDANAGPGDTVLITDLDEIPSPSLLDWREETGHRYTVISARMRTTLFAVDWEVPDGILPPTCVAATVSWLRGQAAKGNGLAQVRDRRGEFPQFSGGGWHFSWLGGVERQRDKLENATCHVESVGAPEGDLIASGERWRTGQHAEGHLPVVPVDVDESWPAFIQERRCPPEWFRPREEAACDR